MLASNSVLSISRMMWDKSLLLKPHPLWHNVVAASANQCKLSLTVETFSEPDLDAAHWNLTECRKRWALCAKSARDFCTIQKTGPPTVSRIVCGAFLQHSCPLGRRCEMTSGGRFPWGRYLKIYPRGSSSYLGNLSSAGVRTAPLHSSRKPNPRDSPSQDVLLAGPWSLLSVLILWY